MIPKPLNQIGKADIDLLIANGVSEGREIEYKAALQVGTDEERKEFLADLSAFANASGGDLIYGVQASDGVPVAAKGLSGIDADEAILQLDNMIRDGIAPRINGLRIQKIDGFADGPVLVIRIPRSWSSPHMVIFRKWSRFYTRNNAGKHQLDVSEIRSAFALSQSLADRIKQFRADRIGRIYAGDTPVALEPGGRLALHLLPLASFTTDFQIDLSQTTPTTTPPLRSGGWDHRYNLDGSLTFSCNREDRSTHHSYTLLFRSGCIEAVHTGPVWQRDEARFVSSNIPERYLIDGLGGYLSALKTLNVPPPFVFFLTLLGVKGAFLFCDNGYSLHRQAPIDRDVLLLPDVMLESYEENLVQALRPVADAVWNAGGFPRCPDYDQQGKWNPQRR